jgi:SAM-dependent methyltransferase
MRQDRGHRVDDGNQQGGARRSGVVPSTSSYEELSGGKGREVFFRPKRYSADELEEMQPQVFVCVGAERRKARLTNVSQTGAALECDAASDLVVDATIKVELEFAGHTAYSGNAIIEWQQVTDTTTSLGISFVDSLLDIDEVLQLREVRVHSQASARYSRRAWRVAGNDRFKAAVGEMAMLFEDAAQQLSHLEGTLPPHALQSTDSLARTELIEWVRSDFGTSFVHDVNEVSSAVTYGQDAREGHKDYLVRNLQRHFLQAPIFHRSFHKPLGYPGDFEVMNYIYERHFEGPTLFAKAVNLGFSMYAPSCAVRGRKDAIKAALREKIANAREGEPIRVLSVAAGPAQELYEFLRDEEPSTTTLQLVLFDQDHQALTFAHKRLTPLKETKWREKVELTYLHDSVKRLIIDPRIFADYGSFDLVFSTGFFDYLRDQNAITVTRTLTNQLRPNGRTLIGNMVPDMPGRWILEFNADWFLNYRTREQMLAFGAAAVGDRDFELSIMEEVTGFNPLLSLVGRR